MRTSLFESPVAATGLIVCVGIAVFSGYLSAGWIYDDSALILNNPWYEHPPALGDFAEDLGVVLANGPMGYWRPGQLLLYRAEYEAFGLNPGAWHLVSILLHILSAVLLYRLVRAVWDARGAALAVALLFLTHPAHSETIGSLNYQISPAAAVFILTAALATLRGRWPITALATWGALSFRESALTAPLVLAAIVWAAPLAEDSQRKRWIAAGAGAVAVAAYIVVRFGLLQMPMPVKEVTWPLMTRVGVTAWMAVRAILAPWPSHLSVYHDLPSLASFAAPGLAIATVAAFGVAGLAAWSWRRAELRPATGLLVAAVAWYAPYSGLVPAPVAFAEHYLYLPIAFLLAASTALAKIPRGRAVVAAAAIAAIAGSSVVTYGRAEVFRDNFSAFSDVLQKYPDVEFIHRYLGRYHRARGQWDEALAAYAHVVERRPDAEGVWLKMGRICEKKGDRDEARRHYERAGLRGQEALAALLYQDRRWDELAPVLTALEARSPDSEVAAFIRERLTEERPGGAFP